MDKYILIDLDGISDYELGLLLLDNFYNIASRICDAEGMPYSEDMFNQLRDSIGRAYPEHPSLGGFLFAVRAGKDGDYERAGGLLREYLLWRDHANDLISRGEKATNQATARRAKSAQRRKEDKNARLNIYIKAGKLVLKDRGEIDRLSDRELARRIERKISDLNLIPSDEMVSWETIRNDIREIRTEIKLGGAAL